MHINELIDTKPSVGHFAETHVKGELQAAKSYLAICRAESDFLNDQEMRMGQHGDDPVDVMTDIKLLLIRQGEAAERVLRAEGILACAQRRHDRWVEEEARKQAVADTVSDFPDDPEVAKQVRIENAEKSAWGTGGP